jgi:glucan 1,3-beta-glucosidase
MTPSIFSELAATDETTLCVELGGSAKDRLTRHWNSFITESDFQWLANVGINAVRIPVGFWIFGPPYPYHPKYGDNKEPFVQGGLEYLDKAFSWAKESGLSVLLDLHAAPGCQNGFDNGGLHNVCDWQKNPEYTGFSLEILKRLASRYGSHESLIGIELLNEPRWDIPTAKLKEFYLRAYHIVRQFCAKEDVAVVFHDGFRSCSEYSHFMKEPEFSNVVFDIHRYQCFDRNDIDMDIHGHIQKAAIGWKNESNQIRADLGLWTYVGEWSLGLDLKPVLLWAPGPFNHALEGLDKFQEDAAYRAYGAAQIVTFERYQGWFFWSYKTESVPAWSFRECVERGWLPRDYRFEHH